MSTYTLATTPVPPSHIYDPTRLTERRGRPPIGGRQTSDDCAARPGQCACHVLCQVCKKPLDTQRYIFRTADKHNQEILGHRVYRLHRDRREYAHAMCVDGALHWIMATTIARSMDTPPNLRDWGPSERALKLMWASAAIHGIRALTGNPDAFIRGDLASAAPDLASAMWRTCRADSPHHPDNRTGLALYLTRAEDALHAMYRMRGVVPASRLCNTEAAALEGISA